MCVCTAMIIRIPRGKGSILQTLQKSQTDVRLLLFARVAVKIMHTRQKLLDSGSDYFENTLNIIYHIVELQ